MSAPLAAVKSFFARNLDLDASHLALAIARITFHLSALAELLHIYTMRQVTYPGAVSWIGNWIVPLDIFFVIALVLGFKTRASAICHYLLFVWFIALNARDVYHFDYVMAYFGMLFIFAPAPKCLSVDSKLEGVNLPKQLIPSWFYFAFTMGIWQYYFDSIIYKFQSVLWTKGIVVYFASLPFRTCFPVSQAFQSEWPIYFLSYSSFAIELIFPLILFRQARLFIAILAILLHAGIMVVTPLPWFGAGMTGALLIYLNWEKIFNFIKIDVSQALPVKKEHARAAMWALPVVLFLMQASMIFTSLPGFVLQATGIRRHALYTDNHFTNPYPILRFVAHEGSRQFEIPTFDEKDCHLHFPNATGRYYVSVNFALRGKWVNNEEIVRFVDGWMKKVAMKPDYVEIFYKNTLLPLELNLDYDDRLLAEPWRQAGKITFATEPNGNRKGELVFNGLYEKNFPKPVDGGVRLVNKEPIYY